MERIVRRQIRIDLLGGARYWYFRNTARLSIPPATLRVGGVPVTGDRVARFADQRVGDSSSFSWQVVPGVGCRS